jgi:uncharacterized protein
VDVIASSFTENNGRKLENAVFLHLRRKYKEIYYFNNKKTECDFVVVEKGQVKEIIQVCYEIMHDNQEREFNGINTAVDELHPVKATIITFNQTDSYIYNNLLVEIIPFYNYFCPSIS